MNKKTFGLALLLTGALIFMGADCAKKGATPSALLGNGVLPTSSEPLTLPGSVTVEECARLFAYAPKIDLRHNTLAASYPWTLKYYDEMAALEKKYGITQDGLSKVCKAKSKEPGFEEKVKEQGKKLGI